QVGDAGDAIDLEHAIRVLLPFVEGAAGEPAEELARVLVAQLPGLGESAEAFQGRAREALALGADVKVDRDGGLEAALGVGVGEVGHGDTPLTVIVCSVSGYTSTMDA